MGAVAAAMEKFVNRWKQSCAGELSSWEYFRASSIKRALVGYGSELNPIVMNILMEFKLGTVY